MTVYFGLGEIGEAIAGRLNAEGIRLPFSRAAIFTLGDRRVENIDNVELYVGISPFSFEVERRFRASVQLRRLIRDGAPVLVVDMDSYEQRMANSELSSISSVLIDEVSELIRAIAKSGEGLDRLKSGAHVIYTQRDPKDVASLAMAAARAVNSIDEIHVIANNGSITPGDANSIIRGLKMIGEPVSLSYVGNNGMMFEIVEGRLKLLDDDVIQRVLGDRVLDLDPEEAVNLPIPFLDRID